MTDIVEKLSKYIAGMGTRKSEDYIAFITVDEAMEAVKEIETLRNLIKDMIYAWDHWQVDPYDRESPSDEIYEMRKHMESLGYKIDRWGITRTKTDNNF